MSVQSEIEAQKEALRERGRIPNELRCDAATLGILVAEDPSVWSSRMFSHLAIEIRTEPGFEVVESSR